MLKLVLRYFKWAFWLFNFISVLWVVIYRFVNPPVTYLMILRSFQYDYPIHYTWVSIDKMSPHIPLAVICGEDQKFFNHLGFDFASMKKAWESNTGKKRIVKGGSTISQQTAKNVFLFPARNWLRKGLEAYFTILIEIFWSKKRILEVYLNVIETGPGIYGVHEAAKHYFHKTPEMLNQSEAAALAACIPSPLRCNPAKLSSASRQRKYWIEKQMRLHGGVKYIREHLH